MSIFHYPGSSLEQKSWLSKTYVVKAGSQGIALGSTDAAPDGEDLSTGAGQPDADVEGESSGFRRIIALVQNRRFRQSSRISS